MHLLAIIEKSVEPMKRVDGIKIVQVDGLTRGHSGGLSFFVMAMGVTPSTPVRSTFETTRLPLLSFFGLVNLVVEAMIATPKHIAAMYEALPESARKAIERRDAENL